MQLFPLLAFSVLAASAACTPGDEAEVGHDEPTDYELAPDDGKGDGVAATFSANTVVGDELFVGGRDFTAAEVQQFLEDSPYGNRSWLASYSVDGVSAAQLVVDASRAHDIHPIMVLARMQVEASLISKSVKPTQRLIDRGLGCGCPDGGGCSSAYRGFGPQLRCGAETLRRRYDDSVDGSGQWRQGVARKTLDPKTVTPSNHATASLYAYTPWVLVGSGGNWLVWNVTRKYVRHAEANGFF